MKVNRENVSAIQEMRCNAINRKKEVEVILLGRDEKAGKETVPGEYRDRNFEEGRTREENPRSRSEGERTHQCTQKHK